MISKEEVGRVPLGNKEELIVYLIDDERLDFKVCVNFGSYTRMKGRGVTFSLEVWQKFFELMVKVDLEYQRIVESSSSLSVYRQESLSS